MSPVTIYDVAEKAEVSIATVSRVLNAPHRVNEITRRRVLATIDDLGFVPKAEATARRGASPIASASWPPSSPIPRLYNASRHL